MKTQGIKNVLDEIISVLNPRVRSVIEKRFGLRSEAYQTLEAIGQNLGITRERVRQIEALGLKQLSNKNVSEALMPAFGVIENYLREHGGVRREDYFLQETADLLKVNEKNRENIINFVLALGRDRFLYFKETPEKYVAWALGGDNYAAAGDLINALKKKLADAGSPVSEDKIFPLCILII